jgi:fermentation-respiration switch protein FrsA (DUF1100 family)
MHEVSIFLFAVAAIAVLLTLAVEPPSSKTWSLGLTAAGAIALFALTALILSSGIAWQSVNPWGPVLILGGPAAGFLWIRAQIHDSSATSGNLTASRGADSPSPDATSNR